MSYNHENYYALRREFEEKHLRAIERADTLKKELWDRISGLREIDEALSGTGARIMGAALGGKEGMEARIAKVRRDVEALREARALLLEQNGYPADYTDVHYECETCRDTGFTDTKMCACFRRALTLRGYETSGVGKLHRPADVRHVFARLLSKRSADALAHEAQFGHRAAVCRNLFAKHKRFAFVYGRHRAWQNASFERAGESGHRPGVRRALRIRAEYFFRTGEF